MAPDTCKYPDCPTASIDARLAALDVKVDNIYKSVANHMRSEFYKGIGIGITSMTALGLAALQIIQILKP